MSMSDWARNEVELACERGACCKYEYESALKAFLSLMEDGHSGASFAFTRNTLNRLMRGKPLTPIEDVPGAWVLISRDELDGAALYLCKRMHSLFKYVYTDGTVKYRDTDYYCKDLFTGAMYAGGGSWQIVERYMDPIKFPYMPPMEPYILNTLTWLTDRKNGDFDTKAYISCIKPDGTCIDIYEYYGESETGEWKQLTEDEYNERVRLHKQREAREKEIEG